MPLSTSASSAAFARSSVRRTGLRCRRGSASSGGGRSHASKPMERTPPRRPQCSALRLPRDRHLRWLRTMRHRLSGRHRDRHSDQGAARTPGKPARTAHRGPCRRPLRGYDRGGAIRIGRGERAARARWHAGDAGVTRQVAQALGWGTAQVVACTGAGRALHAGAARTAAGRWRRCRRLFSQLRRAQHRRAARLPARRFVAGGGRATVREGRFRRGLPAGAGRAVLRAAVREQGPRTDGRPQVGRAGSGVARREQRRAPADRVRHEPLRLSDEALPR